MPEVVCENCQQTQRVTLLDGDPECANCGSKALTQVNRSAGDSLTEGPPS